MTDNVVPFKPKPAAQRIEHPVRVVQSGVFWPAMRLSTMGAPDADFVVEETPHMTSHWAPMGAVICRGRVSFTCVMPSMREPINPAFLEAGGQNDN